LCALSSWIKVFFFGSLVSVDNEDVGALGREGSRSSFLGPEPAISISPCVDRLKVKKWLMKRHSEHWAATAGMRQSKLLIGRLCDKLSMDIVTLERKQCRPVKGLLTGNCTLRQHSHIMDLSESTKCRKCGREEESSFSIFC
jgi:hypothetical protein